MSACRSGQRDGRPEDAAPDAMADTPSFGTLWAAGLFHFRDSCRTMVLVDTSRAIARSQVNGRGVWAVPHAIHARAPSAGAAVDRRAGRALHRTGHAGQQL